MSNRASPPRQGSFWPSNPYCGFTGDSYRFKALAVQSICKLLGRIVFWGAAASFGLPVVAPMVKVKVIPALSVIEPCTASQGGVQVVSPPTSETTNKAK